MNEQDCRENERQTAAMLDRSRRNGAQEGYGEENMKGPVSPAAGANCTSGPQVAPSLRASRVTLTDRLYQRIHRADAIDREAQLAHDDQAAVRELFAIFDRNPDLRRALELLDSLGVR